LTVVPNPKAKNSPTKAKQRGIRKKTDFEEERFYINESNCISKPVSAK